MSNAWDLKRLREKPTRDEILKAELAAWLHDWQKSEDNTIFQQWEKGDVDKEKKEKFRAFSSKYRTDRFLRSFQTIRINICGDSQLAPKMVKIGRHPDKGVKDSPHYLVRLLGLSHDKAHLGKELPPGEQDDLATDWIANPFGYEKEITQSLSRNLVTRVRKALLSWASERNIRLIHDSFIFAPGDTRRPINEVTLWDWSSIVAALYKAEIARCVLTGEQRPSKDIRWRLLSIPFREVEARGRDKPSKDIRWRLLSIRTNGLEYLLSAPSIPDLKVRQELLQDAWNRVQNLLEEEYPMALEVYRDENGPVFVVPDIDNLLGLTDSERNTQTLREFILERFRQGTVQNDPCLALGGEIVPTFNLDTKPWKGQPAPQELPPIWDHVRDDAIPPLKSDAYWVATQWCNLSTPQERCTVCGLRPQGPSPKALRRGRCDVCEKRRAGRAKRWATQELHTTIWLDEVADHNGRIALLVGSFDLTHWLDGTLVRSLAVRTPNDQNGHTANDVAKNPSFARLRRIWETTRKFWEETLKKTEGRLDKRPRIFLKGTPDPQNALAPYHAYELEIQGRKVAVLWVPKKDDEVDIPEKYRGGFWVIENLEYLASQNLFGRSLATVLQEDRQEYYEVYEPTEYGRPGQPVARFYLESIQDKDIPPYIPLIPILAEPRTFMALVPADKAFEVMQDIKAKYEREMGRVRNRLPLHLGVVFADSHQPLRTILDAGRRMLKRASLASIWRVRNAIHRFAKRDVLPQRFHDDAQGQFAAWVELNLERNGRQFTWYVPMRMGDGQTPDFWYAYAFTLDDEKHPPLGRAWFYKAQNPWNSQHPWVVHVSHLRWDDRIYFTPATFDFIFLDHGGRRFEIAYDEQGHRRGTLHRPYLLDEIVELEACWERLKQGLHSRQIHQIRDLIETKRREWFDNPRDSFHDPTFREFCRSVLVNAEWRENHHPEKRGDTQRLTQWAVSGLLADAVELFYHIMKQRPVGEADEDPGSAAT